MLDKNSVNYKASYYIFKYILLFILFSKIILSNYIYFVIFDLIVINFFILSDLENEEDYKIEKDKLNLKFSLITSLVILIIGLYFSRLLALLLIIVTHIIIFYAINEKEEYNIESSKKAMEEYIKNNPEIVKENLKKMKSERKKKHGNKRNKN